APGSRLKRFQNAAKLNSPLYRVRVENVLKSPVPPSTVEVLCRSAIFPNPLSCARAVPHRARTARNSVVILVILMFFLPVPYANQTTHARACWGTTRTRLVLSQFVGVSELLRVSSRFDFLNERTGLETAISLRQPP